MIHCRSSFTFLYNKKEVHKQKCFNELLQAHHVNPQHIPVFWLNQAAGILIVKCILKQKVYRLNDTQGRKEKSENLTISGYDINRSIELKQAVRLKKIDKPINQESREKETKKQWQNDTTQYGERGVISQETYVHRTILQSSSYHEVSHACMIIWMRCASEGWSHIFRWTVGDWPVVAQ